MKRSKKIVFGVLMLVFVLIGAISVGAMVYPNWWYSQRCWTWYYNGPATWSYNCLGYATGSMTWEWPWSKPDSPTSSEVDCYLINIKGYKNSGTWPCIISYGSTSRINHFSRVTGSSWCRAKWGELELLDHGSWSPYIGWYGPKIKVYYRY